MQLFVPLDETELSARALPVAGALAAATGATITLLTVGEPGVLLELAASVLESDGRLTSGLRVTRVIVAPGGHGIGPAVAAEARAADDAVVVMATHARNAAGAMLLGSVADDVVRAATAPVVLVGPRCEVTDVTFDGPVLAAVDGTPLDDAVLATTRAWHRRTDAPVHVVHALVPADLGPDRDLASWFAGELQAGGVPAVGHAPKAITPATGIVRVIAEIGASAVIVGSRRPDRLERSLTGSTAMALTHRCVCPVVVVGATLPPVRATVPDTTASAVVSTPGCVQLALPSLSVS